VCTKGLSLVGSPSSGETSRLGSMDTVAERNQLGPHGNKISKTKPWTGAGAG
jgi:hypothetical protein